MKKLLSLLLSVLMIISTFAVLPLSAYAEQDGDWTFIRNSANTECVITGNTGNKYIAALLLPKQIAGLKVIECMMHLKEYYNLRTLALYVDMSMTSTPDTYGCTNLSKIDVVSEDGNSLLYSNVLPDSIKEVTYGTFSGSQLSELTLPNVTVIGKEYSTGAFEDCDHLKKVTISKPARMYNDTFACIDSECDVDYNGSISNWNGEIVRFSPKLIANCTDGWFGWCGDSWDGTGYEYDRSNLYWKLTKSGELTVDSISDDEFLDKQTVMSHRWNAFAVTSLNLNNVTNTGKETFRYVEIPTLELPSTVKTIGDYSFANCGKLTEVHIPSSVKNIGNYAFAYCDNLKDIYFDGTKAEWDAINKKNGWNAGLTNCKVHFNVTVNFNANGHGSAPASQNLVSSKDKVTEPAAPSVHQWELRGWYTEPECVNEWNFDNTVEEDMTLYAKWERVIFNINVVKTEGGNATADRSEAYERTLIHLDPKTSEGWVFKDWEVVSGSTTVQHDSFMMPAEDVTVQPVYEKIENPITVVAATGGTAGADKNTAVLGETVNLTATPDAGWKFKEWEVISGDVTVNGEENASFTMTAKPYTVIRAVFERITYKLTINTNGHGRVDTGYETDGVPAGWDVNLIPYADSGYRLKDISFMTEGVDFRYPYIFNMPAFDVYLYAEFEAIPVSAININTTGNGTVSANKNSAESGENVYLTVTPDEGNRLKCINVTSGNTELWLDEGGYGFEMPDTEVSILAEFEEIPPIYQLSGEDVIFFDESINKITEAEAGSTVTVNANDANIPEGYYFTNNFLANGVEIITDEYGNGDFTMPNHDVIVTPVFDEQQDGEVYLTDENPVVLPEKDLAGFLIEGSEYYYYDDVLNKGCFDFNEDDVADVYVDADSNSLSRGPGADSIGSSFTIVIDYTFERLKYKTLTVVFADEPQTEHYEVKPFADEGGSVQGGALYEKGANATVIATPDNNYEFSGWYENGEKVSSDAEYSFEVTGYTFLVAKFTKYCTVSVTAESGGTADGGAVLLEGSTAHVKAIPNSGYKFDGWYKNGVKVSASASYSFEVTEDTHLVAKFSKSSIVSTIKMSGLKRAYNTASTSLKITVYDSFSKPVEGRKVSVDFNGKVQWLITDAKGVVNYSISTAIRPNTYTVTATCEGVKATAKVTITKDKPKITAKNKTFKQNAKTKKYSVTFKTSKNKALKKVQVTIIIKGKTYKAITNAKGKAVFKIKLTKKGNFNATVKFAGNDYYKAVSKKVKITVK